MPDSVTSLNIIVLCRSMYLSTFNYQKIHNKKNVIVFVQVTVSSKYSHLIV